jgi:hypothetical protein
MFPELLIKAISVALLIAAIFALREVGWRAGIITRWQIGVYLRDPTEDKWYLAWERYGITTRWTRLTMQRALDRTWANLLELNHNPVTTRVFAFPRYAPTSWVETHLRPANDIQDEVLPRDLLDEVILLG